MRKIVVSEVNPRVLQQRSHDYRAYFDGEENAAHFGYGAEAAREAAVAAPDHGYFAYLEGQEEVEAFIEQLQLGRDSV